MHIGLAAAKTDERENPFLALVPGFKGRAMEFAYAPRVTSQPGLSIRSCRGRNPRKTISCTDVLYVFLRYTCLIRAASRCALVYVYMYMYMSVYQS